MRRALTSLLGVAALLGLGCRQLAGIEDIEPSDATGTDASRSDASGKDGSRADATADGGREAAACVKIPVDAAIPDALPDAACPISGACTPDPSVGFSPTWVPPRAHESRCTATQIGDLFDLCFGPTQTMTTCNSWIGENHDCSACVFSSSTDPAYGPVVNDVITNIQTVNLGGCVALLEPCNLECAHVMQWAQQCFQAACDMHCPKITNAATYNELVACQTNAVTCPCEAYTAVLSECEDTIAARASAAFTCTQANDALPSYFKQMVSLFAENDPQQTHSFAISARASLYASPGQRAER